jgi:ribonuclease Z
MKAAMTLLGVGTGVPDADRGHTHMVWKSESGGLFLVDAGGSTYQRLLKAGHDPRALRGVVLTHSHCDHINGLAALLFSLALVGRTEPLLVYGLAATCALALRVVEAFELEDYMVPVQWTTLDPGDEVVLDDGWVLQTTLTDHSRPCLGLRFQHRQSPAALAYSADTGPCAAVANLAQQAAILVHEATVAQPMPGHSTPRQAGDIARQAGVGELVLVHFSPHWTMPEAQALDEIRASGFTGAAAVGQEYQILRLGA